MANDVDPQIRKTVSLPTSLWRRIEDYQFANRIKRDAEAVRILVEVGLSQSRSVATDHKEFVEKAAPLIAKIDKGEPVYYFTADVPLRVVVVPTGQVAIDCIMGTVSTGQAIVCQLALTSAAAQNLKAILNASENIPDGFLAAADPKKAN